MGKLLLNCLEHAFAGLDKGSVLLQLTDEGDQVVIEVIDDGVGLAARRGRAAQQPGPDHRAHLGGGRLERPVHHGVRVIWVCV